MTLSPPSIRQLALGLLAATLVAAIAALVAASYALRPPTLDGVNGLLTNGQFDAAEAMVGKFLLVNPNSSQANLLMAQVALARQDKKPELALKHLAKVRSPDRALRALVQLNEGKALATLGRYDRAEAAWLSALRTDPLVPEAGWALLGLYYSQGRRREAHELAMKLYAIEPDPRDKVQLLLELLRQDVKIRVDETVVSTFEATFREHPEDFHSAIAYGIALTRTSRPDEGLPVLRKLVEQWPKEPAVWEGLLTGLDEAFRYDDLKQALSQTSKAVAFGPRFERFRGALLQSEGQASAAADAYRIALTYDPSDQTILRRLSQTLRTAGRIAEADQLEPARTTLGHVREQATELYNEANAIKTLAALPNRGLYHRLADIRERMGRDDEARLWHRLVLEYSPGDPISLAANERILKAINERAQAPRDQSSPR